MSVTESIFPYLPHEDSVSVHFWQATRKRELHIQFCEKCEIFQWYPRAICISCGLSSISWRKVSGQAHIDSWSEVHRAPQDGFVPPYVISRVLLEEKILFLTRLVGEAAIAPQCDSPVTLTWQELSDGRALPVFE